MQEGRTSTPNGRSRLLAPRWRQGTEGRRDPERDGILAGLLQACVRAAQAVTAADGAVGALWLRAHPGSPLIRASGEGTHLSRAALERAVRLGIGPRARAGRSGAPAVASFPINLPDHDGCLMVLRQPARPFSSEEMAALRGAAEALGTAVQDVGDVVRAERRRLARDVHDTFGQTLTCLIFAIDELEGAVWSPEHRLLTRAVRDHGLRAVRQVRELVSSASRASEAGEAGEKPCGRLADLVKELPQTGIAVRFRSDPEHLPLPAAVETGLYQVAREALLNVTRHARATRVDVGLRRGEREIELVVADDGHGFRPSEVPSTGWGGFGLRDMRERVEELGGTFALESAPGAGTRVVVRLPAPPITKAVRRVS